MPLLVTDELWEAVRPLLPAHPASPKGGRPRVGDRECLTGLVFPTAGRSGVAVPAPGDGVRVAGHRLAAAAGVGRGRRLAGRPRPPAGSPRRGRAGGPGRRGHRLGQRAGGQRGAHTGPNPTDRGKAGSKRHVLTDRHGLPLAVVTGPANQRDEQRVEELLDAVPLIPDGRGHLRDGPRRLLADAGYGFWWVFALLMMRGIRPLIRRRGRDVPHGSGLGKRRYVVERTMAWFAGFRRLRVCYERTPAHWQAMNGLAACVICANRLHKVRQAERLKQRF